LITFIILDIEIDALEDVRILVLLWKLGAKDKPAQINRDEWMKGCAELQIDSVAKLKALIPSLDLGFLDETAFLGFYEFAFQFSREGTHRTLDKGLVIELMKLVLVNRIDQVRIDSVVGFLENQNDVNRITLDQWKQVFSFLNEVQDVETDYDEDGAWPVLIDEYVEYLKTKK